VPGGRLTASAGDVTLADCDVVRVDEGRYVFAAADTAEARRLTISTRHGDVTQVAPASRLVLAFRPRRAEVVVVAGRFVLKPSSPDDGQPLEASRGDLAVAVSGQAPRLNVWPFGRSVDQRPGRASDHLPAFWSHAGACATGCRPAGAQNGWPLRPFNRQHGLRAGMNEWRPANMHTGIDIQARDRAPVYAVQSGVARVLASGGVDERVQVGSYIYWHINHAVRSGQFVTAFKTVVGTIIPSAGHLHLSEVRGGQYLNPLRPGGRVLIPWSDTEAPIIGPPVLGRATGIDVEIFDPQSYREHVGYRTPVLAPAAVAYRAADSKGHDLTGLRFSYRGAQHLGLGARSLVYASDTYPPGWTCFATRDTCVPRWDYRLTGGFAPSIPAGARYLTIYAWDWAGNTSARRVDLRQPPAPIPGRASAASRMLFGSPFAPLG
jgi:murein DD-endopeptidase MepM/ murein hydrolase activator NlpD